MNKNNEIHDDQLKYISSIKLLMVLTFVMIVTLLGLNYYNGYESNQQIDSLVSTAQMHELTIDLEAKSLQMRRIEKDFLLRKDIVIAEKYSETTNNAMDVVEKIKLNPYYKSIAKSSVNMTKQLQMLYQQFDKVVKTSKKIGLNENSGLTKDMRDSAHAIERILIESKQTVLQNNLLNMRRDEKDFMMRKDKKYIDNLIAKQKIFLAALKSSTIDDNDKNDISTKLNEYVAAFKSLSVGEIELNRDVAKLTAIYSVFSTILEETQGFVETMRDNSVDQVKEFKLIMHMVLTAISVIFLLLISLLSVNILRLHNKMSKTK